jgi:hypothetical protein
MLAVSPPFGTRSVNGASCLGKCRSGNFRGFAFLQRVEALDELQP